MYKCRIPLIIALCAISFIQLFAQEASVNWSIDVSPAKRFIENKSQFDGKNELPGSNILYGIDWGTTQIYFTNNGLTYRFEERKKIDKSEERKRERERAEKASHGKPFTRIEDEEIEVERDVVQMRWLGANPDARLTGVASTDDYFSYTIGKDDAVKNVNHIKGYEKLLYENLYPNIDVEYTFHAEVGIKYKLILHPGADVSQIKMQYSGSKKVMTDELGNLRIGTSFGDIIDHAPLTFYSKNEKRVISSLFNVSGDVISFVLDDYNHSKTIIIDPWTVTPNMPSATKVYYIKADSSGNAYIYGGDSPHRLQKFTAAGALAWNYNTTYTAADWFGALAVDLAGNSYITSATGTISKINTSGGLVWSRASGGAFSLTEFWAPTFNCDYTQLLIGGTYAINPLAFQFYGAAYEIDLSNGAIASTIQTTGTLVGAPNNFPFIPNEVRSMTYSPNGNYYFLSLDTIGMITPLLTIGYRDSSFYNLSYYLPYGTGGGQGVNGICATAHLLYTTDGQVLHRRDINSGAIINTVFIPSGSVELCSGIAVDSCGNVYVGAIGKVHKYDSNLNLVTTANTPGEVYGVAVTTNGEVLASGHGFAMSINMSACDAQRPVCHTTFNVVMSHTDVLCNGGCDGTAMANPSDGTAPYSYVWSNGQSTQSISNICAGIYVVTVTDATNAFSIASVTIKEPPIFTVSVTSSVTTCGTSAIATPSSGIAPFSYSWSNGATTAFISSLATGTYYVTVSDGNNCSATGSASVVQSPGLAVTTSSTSPACDACDGIALATPSGGNAPFGYLWSNGDTTPTTSGLCPGIYVVTVAETGGGGTAVFWNEDFTNGRGGWSLNNNGTGANGSAPNRWVVNNSRDAGCPQCPSSGSGGNYLHVTCDSASFFCAPMGGPGCVYSPGFPVIFNNATDRYVTSPNISTIGKTSITLSFWYMADGDTGIDYGLVRLSNDGGNTWTDLPTQYAGTLACTQATINVPVAYENIPNFRIGFRWINDNDLNGNSPPFLIDDIELSATEAPCTAVSSIIINSVDAPVVSIDSIIDVSCKNAGDGAVQIAVSGGNPPYSYEWERGDTLEDITGLSGGSYFVTVTDTADCIAIQVATVREPSAISVTGIVASAGCTVGGTIDISVSGGTEPYSYLWTRSDTTQDLNNVQSGAYEVTITDINNCTKTAIFNVSSPAIFLSLEATDASCGGVSDGAVTTTLLGGTSPFQYSWSSGDTTSNLPAIPGGTYTLTVSDNSGCSAVQSATVESPPMLNMTASINKVQCKAGSDGGIKVNPLGGRPEYSASWDNGQTGLTLTALTTGTYTVTVTDSLGCTRDSSFQLTSVSIYTVEPSASDALCDGTPTGSLQANIISATTPPYSYAWSTGDTTASVSNVVPGIHTVTVSDALECDEIETIEVLRGLTIQETVVPPCPSLSNGSIIPIVSGGTEPYNFIWNTGATSSTLVNIDAGTYFFTVTDQGDCRGSDTVIVMTDTSNIAFCDTIVFYDVFSPNGDGRNDLWVIDGVQRFPENEIQIFNRWGSIVFETKPYNNDWDGRSEKDELLPPATYYYILKLNDTNQSVYSGNITLLR